MTKFKFILSSLFATMCFIAQGQQINSSQMSSAYAGLAVPAAFQIGQAAAFANATSDDSEYLPYAHPIFGTEDSEVSKEDFLPYAEPLFGMEDADYQEYMADNREGALMERVMELNNMELQAVYADSKMNEINLSFNSFVAQELLVTVYNELGQKVATEIRNAKSGFNNYSIDTNNLNSGFYSMVVIGMNDQFIQRFIIE